MYTPNPKVEKQKVTINISKYNNKGFTSQIIK
jgi:hypothetical protein